MGVLSRSKRGRLLRARNRVSSKSSRSARPLLAVPSLPPPLPFRAMGTSHRMVQQGGRGRPGELVPRSSISPRLTPGPAMIRRPKRPWLQLQKVYPGFTVQTWVGHTFFRRSDLQRAIPRASPKGLPQGGLPEGDKAAEAAAAKDVELTRLRLVRIPQLGCPPSRSATSASRREPLSV